jgi:hypothetical protein
MLAIQRKQIILKLQGVATPALILRLIGAGGMSGRERPMVLRHRALATRSTGVQQ